MTVIPNRLRKSDFRFIAVNPHDKRPVDFNWSDDKNYSYDDPVLGGYLRENWNYGVCGGAGGLVIIDCDIELVEDAVKAELPPTFSVRTGSGGAHFYYFCPMLRKPIRLYDPDKPDESENIGDVQGFGKMVIGPDSIHPNGNKYTIDNDIEITEVRPSEIRRFAYPFQKKPSKKPQDYSSSRRNLDDLNVSDIVNLRGFKEQGGEYQGEHPVHGSKTGVNFRVDPANNRWYCFRDGVGGGAVKLLAVVEGIIRCDEAGEMLCKEDFKKVIKIAEEKYGVKPRQTSKSNTKNTDKRKEEKKVIKFRIRNKKNTDEVVKSFEGYPLTCINKDDGVFTVEENDTTKSIAKTLEDTGIIEILEKTGTLTLEDLKGAKIGTAFMFENTTKVIKFIGKECILHIHIHDHIYDCTMQDAFSLAKFRTFMASAFSCVFAAKTSEYYELLAHWLSIAEERDYGKLDVADGMKERMINFLNAQRIYQYEQGDTLRKVMYIPDKYSGVVWVVGDEIAEMFSNGNDTSMRKISADLSPILSGRTKEFGSNPRHRYWQFNAKKCGVNTDKVIDNGD